VFKLSADGSVLRQVRGFEAPVAVAVDPRDGSVWVSDFSTTTTNKQKDLSALVLEVFYFSD